jgi:hypothetical protein
MREHCWLDLMIWPSRTRREYWFASGVLVETYVSSLLQFFTHDPLFPKYGVFCIDVYGWLLLLTQRVSLGEPSSREQELFHALRTNLAE